MLWYLQIISKLSQWGIKPLVSCCVSVSSCITNNKEYTCCVIQIQKLNGGQATMVSKSNNML